MAEIQITQQAKPVHILPYAEFGCSGVYFLWRDGLVVYVGQASNMRKRIGEHLAENVKTFDSVSCEPCEKEILTRLERHYIGKFVPQYNRCSLAIEARRLGKLGWRSAGESISRTKDTIPASLVARMLGVGVDDLAHIPGFPVPVVRRTPRKREIYQAYLADQVLEYTTSKAVVLPA